MNPPTDEVASKFVDDLIDASLGHNLPMVRAKGKYDLAKLIEKRDRETILLTRVEDIRAVCGFDCVPGHRVYRTGAAALSGESSPCNAARLWTNAIAAGYSEETVLARVREKRS